MPRWFAILLLVVLGLAAAAFALGRPYSRKPLEDFVAAEKKAGRPTTIRAAIGPDPAAEENGAPALTAAAREFDQRAGDDSTWGVVGPWKNDGDRPWFETATPEELAALGRFVDAQRPFFDGVAAALAKPRLQNEVQRGTAGEPESDDVMTRVRIIHLLTARAVAASSPRDRLDSIVLLATLASRFESATMIDEMVAALAMRDALTAMRCSVVRGDVDVAAARERLDPLLRMEKLPHFPEIVRRERVWLIETLMASPTYPPPHFMDGEHFLDRLIGRVRAVIDGPATPTGSPEDVAEGMRAVASLESLPVTNYARLAADLRAAADGHGEGTSARLMVGNYVRLAEALAQTDAAQRLARIALAAAAHRARTGALPASLDDLRDALGGDAPLDPYTGAAFDFAATPDGIRISTDGRLPGTAAPSETRFSGAPLVWDLKR